MLCETANPSLTLEWGVAARALPGQTVSGDLHLVKPFRDGILIAVVDGIGHGEEAAFAARSAVAVLADHPQEPLIPLIKRCHAALAKNRGAVMTLVSIQLGAGTLAWIGVGNVEGALWRADPLANPSREMVLMRGGIIGHQLPPLFASTIAINPGDLLILCSDGIRQSALNSRGVAGEPVQAIADRILAQHYKGTDDGLALVARFSGGDHE